MLKLENHCPDGHVWGWGGGQDMEQGCHRQLSSPSAHGAVLASQLANLRGPFCPHEWLLGLGLGSYWAPTPDWLPRFLIQIPRPQVSSLVIY